MLKLNSEVHIMYGPFEAGRYGIPETFQVTYVQGAQDVTGDNGDEIGNEEGDSHGGILHEEAPSVEGKEGAGFFTLRGAFVNDLQGVPASGQGFTMHEGLSGFFAAADLNSITRVQRMRISPRTKSPHW